MRALVCCLFVLGLAAVLAAQDPGGEIDEREVLRRGDSVTYTGDGHEAGDDLWTAALAMPDDSHKWFISVVAQKNCPHCDRLKSDWARERALLAWADPHDPKQSWAHFHVYDAADPTQRHRWEHLGRLAYPTILVQPPLNGQFGDPKTVVVKIDGYAGPEQLAQKMAAGVKLYLKKLAEARQPGYRQAGNDAGGITTLPWGPAPSTPPAMSVPFQVPPAEAQPATLAQLRAACPGADDQFLLAQLEAQATVAQAQAAWAARKAPPAADTPGGGGLVSWLVWLAVAALGATQVGTIVTLWGMYRTAASSAGIQLMVDEATFQRIRQQTQSGQVSPGG